MCGLGVGLGVGLGGLVGDWGLTEGGGAGEVLSGARNGTTVGV